jgi:hypothetical protein
LVNQESHLYPNKAESLFVVEKHLFLSNYLVVDIRRGTELPAPIFPFIYGTLSNWRLGFTLLSLSLSCFVGIIFP